MDILTTIDIHLREKLNPIFAPVRRRRLQSGNEHFTIISNDCWAGHVYRYFNMLYDSPTIGTGFFASDYLRFVSHLKDYMEMELKEMDPHDSKHWIEIKTGHKWLQTCPYGVLGDVELRFSHYSSFAVAYDKWCRRRDRMHWDNILLKMSEHTEQILRDFDALPYERKVTFVTKDYGLKSQVIYKEYLGTGEIKNNTAKFRKYINLENWINGLPFKKNQF